MHMDWIGRAEVYCDDLDRARSDLHERLAAVRTALVAGEAEDLQTQSQGIGPILEDLRLLSTERQQLLECFPGEGPVHSLTAALSALEGERAAALSRRVTDLGRQLRAVHRDTLALFVAEYHLVQTTEDLLALLTTGALSYAAYADSGAPAGRIFDRAA